MNIVNTGSTIPHGLPGSKLEGLMYFVLIIFLLLIFPAVSVITDPAFSRHTASTIFLIGKWFAFWAVGIRLFIAGARQVIQPEFTAEEIFAIHDRASFAIVREVGFANLSMGVLGICSVFRVGWIVPAALVGALYYGLAGMGHLFQRGKNAKESMAMISDVFVPVPVGQVVNLQPNGRRASLPLCVIIGRHSCRIPKTPPRHAVAPERE
jgi:hypothetical protein